MVSNPPCVVCPKADCPGLVSPDTKKGKQAQNRCARHGARNGRGNGNRRKRPATVRRSWAPARR